MITSNEMLSSLVFVAKKLSSEPLEDEALLFVESWTTFVVDFSPNSGGSSFAYGISLGFSFFLVIGVSK